MQTELHPALRDSRAGARAEQILRTCVHCGFCNATCPTYQVTGDELDGPRGRIYLIKGVLETGEANPTAQKHLDRCLTCRACETTCPSGVAYGELLETGREHLQVHQPRGRGERFVRRWLQSVVPEPSRFARWVRLGRVFRWLLPGRLRRQLPRGRRPRIPPQRERARRVLVLQGCVQRVMTPQANATFARLLNRHDVEMLLADSESCCGALDLHLGDRERALAAVRRNIDALLPHLDTVEAVVSTASGCGVTLKDYPRLLADDARYAPLAARVAHKVQDAAEYVLGQNFECGKLDGPRRVAWHPPCTLQHGQRITGIVEKILTDAGYELVPVRDAHLCCGSAGTYSILQPRLANALRAAKVAALAEQAPDVVATANVGCQLHLAAAGGPMVRHWLELVR